MPINMTLSCWTELADPGDLWLLGIPRRIISPMFLAIPQWDKAKPEKKGYLERCLPTPSQHLPSSPEPAKLLLITHARAGRFDLFSQSHRDLLCLSSLEPLPVWTGSLTHAVWCILKPAPCLLHALFQSPRWLRVCDSVWNLALLRVN